jgi:hypothetical protein
VTREIAVLNNPLTEKDRFSGKSVSMRENQKRQEGGKEGGRERQAGTNAQGRSELLHQRVRVKSKRGHCNTEGPQS